jgi:voltage-gated potassium channel
VRLDVPPHGDRVGWLSALTAIIVRASSQQPLDEFADHARYGDALRAAAPAAITGEPLAQPGGFAQVMEILLAVYSVAVFATLAGTLGAYCLRSDAATATPEPGAPDISR